MPQFEDKSQRSKKPSLLPSLPVTATGSKVFAKLEYAREAKPLFKRRAGWFSSKWVMGGLGMLAVGAVIATYQIVTTPLHSPRKVMDTDPDMSAKSRVIAPGHSEPELQGLAALIVNDPSGGDNAVTRDSPALAANPVIASAPLPMPTQTQAPDQDNAHKLPRSASVVARQNTAASPQPVARRPPSAVNTPPAPNPAQQSIKSAVVPAKPQTANPDRDVALLTALVAHGAPPPTQRSAPQTTRQAQPSPRTAENTPKGTKNAQSTSAATAVKTREPNRDIVERNPNDTTDALLQRCKQLGFFEGEFCRWRICSGRWESDAACKMPQSTSF